MAQTLKLIVFLFFLLGLPGMILGQATVDFKSGMAALQTGNLDVAQPLLESAAQDLPDSVEAQLALAECYLKNGQLGKAIKQYRKVLELSPDHARVKPIVEALTGQRKSFQQKLASTEALMQINAFPEAVIYLNTFIDDVGANLQERRAASLLQIESQLWSGNQNQLLSRAMGLAETSDDASTTGSAKIIAALAMLRSVEHSEQAIVQAENIIRSAGAVDEPWSSRAKLVQAFFELMQGENLVVASGNLRSAFSQIPGVNFRNWAQDFAANKLLQAASDSVAQGSTDRALQIVWPMLSSRPMPAAEQVGKPIKIEGGWLLNSFTSTRLRERITRVFTHTGQAEVRQSGPEATLYGYWLAAEYNRQTGSLEEGTEVLLYLAEELSKLSRPTPKRESGSLLSPADRLQQIILLDTAKRVTNEKHRDTLTALVIGQVHRYEAANDLQTGLAQFVSVTDRADGGAAAIKAQTITVHLSDELAQLGPSTAHKKLLLELSAGYSGLGKKAFDKNAATLKQGVNESLNQNDRIAATLLSQVQRMYVGNVIARKQADEIVERYAAAGHNAAALNAIDIVHANQLDDSGRWAAVELKLKQSITNENQRLATNRKLGDRLSDLISQSINEVVKIVESDTRPVTRKKAVAFVQQLINRYAGFQRFDLAQTVVDKFADAGQGKLLADWALWSRINLLDQQAARSLASTTGKPDAEQTTPLDPFHKSELELIDRLLAEHGESEYRHSAVNRVMQISQAYQDLKSYDVATKILQDFLKSNTELTNSEQIEYQVVRIAIYRARQGFTDRPNKDKPPTELSDEYANCILKLTTFLKAHPTGDYSVDAENQLFNVVTVYGGAGAWTIARDVLDSFAAAIPDFRSPEHLKLLTAATWLGELDGQYGITLLTPLPTNSSDPASFSGAIESLAANMKPPVLMDIEELESSKLGAAGAEWVAGQAFQSRGGRISDGPTTERDSVASSPVGDLANSPDDARQVLRVESSPRPSQTALATIRQSQQRQFHQLAMLEKKNSGLEINANSRNQAAQRGVQDTQSISLPTGSVLSEAEMKRQDQAADQAYTILLDIINTAESGEAAIKSKARSQVMWLFGFFEGQLRADRAMVLINRYLTDQPNDPAKVALAYQAINDQLTWAAQRQPNDRVNLAWLEKRHELFNSARQSIDRFVADFEQKKDWVQQAQLLTADSYQREAELTAAVSRVRAGGLMVRSADALVMLLQTRPDHPDCGGFDQRLWNIAERLHGMGQLDGAVYVLSQIPIHFPTHSLAQRSVLRIAELHAVNLNQPLKAVETYQEFLSLNGDNENVRSQIFAIAQQLAQKQRYLESLHVFGVFVDSFPTDARAAQALQAMGKTHQTNEAWDDAIQAYQRILAEYKNASIAPQVKLAVAECQINLSRWRDAKKLYEEFAQQYPKDGNAATATARLVWLKKLDRYETLLADPEVTRHKDDAQFEIGRIVLTQFANPVKAIEEFEKAVRNYPNSEVADDAQLEIGKAYLSLSRMDDARQALLQVPAKYPTSPFADDALYLVARSYEQQAADLASVTLSKARAAAFGARQKGAYKDFNESIVKLEQQQARKRIQLKSAGKSKELALDEASQSFRQNSLAISGLSNTARRAEQQAETESALQVANRQDRINEANREAIALYMRAATDYPLGDKTDDSLLRVAQIFETQLKDRPAAMETYQKIVKLFPGTPVAEDAAWNVALFHEQEGRYKLAVSSLRDFIRSYPSSSRIADAQYSLAEALEEMGRWIDAMDEYEIFRQKFSDHPKAVVAMDQINWIRTYRK